MRNQFRHTRHIPERRIRESETEAWGWLEFYTHEYNLDPEEQELLNEADYEIIVDNLIKFLESKGIRISSSGHDNNNTLIIDFTCDKPLFDKLVKGGNTDSDYNDGRMELIYSNGTGNLNGFLGENQLENVLMKGTYKTGYLWLIYSGIGVYFTQNDNEFDIEKEFNELRKTTEAWHRRIRENISTNTVTEMEGMVEFNATFDLNANRTMLYVDEMDQPTRHEIAYDATLNGKPINPKELHDMLIEDTLECRCTAVIGIKYSGMGEYTNPVLVVTTIETKNQKRF